MSGHDKATGLSNKGFAVLDRMRATHTPGPWYAAGLRTQGNPSSNGCDIGAANGANVALAIHQSTDRDASETIANARLIAAAPDLLAAVCSTEAFLASQDGPGARALSDQIRRAIAKAKVSA